MTKMRTCWKVWGSGREPEGFLGGELPADSRPEDVWHRWDDELGRLVVEAWDYGEAVRTYRRLWRERASS